MFFFTFYIYNGDMKALKSAILPTPKWAVVDFSDFNYTKLQDHSVNMTGNGKRDWSFRVE